MHFLVGSSKAASRTHSRCGAVAFDSDIAYRAGSNIERPAFPISIQCASPSSQYRGLIMDLYSQPAMDPGGRSIGPEHEPESLPSSAMIISRVAGHHVVRRHFPAKIRSR